MVYTVLFIFCTSYLYPRSSTKTLKINANENLKTRQRRTFGIGHQPLQNLLSTSIDLFHDTETLKTRLSDIYWEYFLEYYNELTSCTWHIRCGCPIGPCSVQKTTQTVTDWIDMGLKNPWVYSKVYIIIIIFIIIGPNVGGLIAPWSLIREILVQRQCDIYSFKAYFTGNWMSYVPSRCHLYFGQNSGFQVPYPRKMR